MILTILIFTMLLMMIQEAFRRYHWLTWTIFLGLAIVLIPFAIKHPTYSCFYWVKSYTLIFSLLWMQTCRNTKLGKKSWPFLIIVFFLMLNIGEAAFKDLFSTNILSHINALAGFFLIACLPFFRNLTIGSIKQFNDFYWDIPYSWIIAYTVWNWIFVYLNWPQYAGWHIAILLSALLVSLQKRERWCQTRAFTLGITTIPLPLLSTPLLNTMNTTSWENTPAAHWWVLLSVVLAGLQFFYNVFYKRCLR